MNAFGILHKICIMHKFFLVTSEYVSDIYILDE